MKKSIFWLCLLCTIHLSAQDRILTLKQDTLKAKVNSIDKQKIIYFLEADNDKKLQELPVADVHKIIWRTGFEYIINQEFEDKQKTLFPNRPQTKPVSTTKPVEQNQKLIEQKKEVIANTPPVEAPEITMKNNLVWITFRVNGKKVKRQEVERILRVHDYECHEVFRKGSNFFGKGQIIIGVSVVVFTYWIASSSGDILQYITSFVGMVGSSLTWNSIKIMDAAIKEYEFRRYTYSLTPEEHIHDTFIP
jgi:hypothetical protein